MAFSLGVAGNYAAIPSWGDLSAMANVSNPKVASLASAGVADTLTGFQIAAGIYVRSGATAAVAVTTDTATNIITALGGANGNVTPGMSFMLIYANLNTASGAVTVAGGTGVTTQGTLTIPVAGMRIFVGTVTNVAVPAVTLTSAFSLGSGVAA